MEATTIGGLLLKISEVAVLESGVPAGKELELLVRLGDEHLLAV